MGARPVAGKSGTTEAAKSAFYCTREQNMPPHNHGLLAKLVLKNRKIAYRECVDILQGIYPSEGKLNEWDL